MHYGVITGIFFFSVGHMGTHANVVLVYNYRKKVFLSSGRGPPFYLNINTGGVIRDSN